MGALQVSIRPQASVPLTYAVRPSEFVGFEVETTDDAGCSGTTHGFTTETDAAAWIAQQLHDGSRCPLPAASGTPTLARRLLTAPYQFETIQPTPNHPKLATNAMRVPSRVDFFLPETLDGLLLLTDCGPFLCVSTIRPCGSGQSSPAIHDNFPSMAVYSLDAVICVCPGCGSCEFSAEAGPGLDPVIACLDCGLETTIGLALRAAGGSLWNEDST
jgi:hypothetical protein